MTGETEAVKICRMNINETKGRMTILNFQYLIGTGDGVTHCTECHKLGLFTVEEMTSAFKAARLVVEFDSKGLMGRGLYCAKDA